MAKGRAEKFNDTHENGRIVVDTAHRVNEVRCTQTTTLQYMRQPPATI